MGRIDSKHNAIGKGDRRQKQNKVTVGDPERKKGDFEELYRFLEERYGYSREEANEEENRRIRKG